MRGKRSNPLRHRHRRGNYESILKKKIAKTDRENNEIVLLEINHNIIEHIRGIIPISFYFSKIENSYHGHTQGNVRVGIWEDLK